MAGMAGTEMLGSRTCSASGGWLTTAPLEGGISEQGEKEDVQEDGKAASHRGALKEGKIDDGEVRLLKKRK